MKIATLAPLFALLGPTLSAPTDVSLNLTVVPRELFAGKNAKMEIMAFSGGGCKDGAVSVMKIHWTDNRKADIRSVQLSRDLDPSEQLDFSAGWQGHECINYLESAPNGLRKGCWDLHGPAMCLRLWYH